jgi:hypothetical protein
LKQGGDDVSEELPGLGDPCACGEVGYTGSENVPLHHWDGRLCWKPSEAVLKEWGDDCAAFARLWATQPRLRELTAQVGEIRYAG